MRGIETPGSSSMNVHSNRSHPSTLPPADRESPDFKDGDVDDPATGYSAFPGNVNNLLVKIPSYAAVLAGPDQGVVDEFVNPKYKVSLTICFYSNRLFYNLPLPPPLSSHPRFPFALSPTH